jgi:FkbH-like protein
VQSANETQPRDEVAAAIAAGDFRRAAYWLGRIWHEQPSSRTASYILSRAGELRADLPLVRHKVFFLRSFTLEPLAPLLQAQAFVSGLDLDVQIGDFNAYAQEMLDPQSRLYRFAPDTAVLALQARDIVPALWNNFAELGADAVQSLIESTLTDLHRWIESFRKYSRANLIVHSLELPAYPCAGILDAQVEGQAEAIHRLNHGLARIAQSVAGVSVLDYDALVSRHGRLNWHDEEKWLTARLPIRATFLPALAAEYLRFLLPLSGRVAKALVVDLDNTLWGGVVGEDGIDGIKVGKELPGAPYLALQRAILDLYQRGIILAVCSKNNFAEALEALEKHPGMLLRPRHFAALRINWQDKAANLKELAAELNIGTEALAFLDDNPVERDRVRREMAEVFVIDLPAEPLGYARALREFPAFERLSLTEEDRSRGRMYAEQRRRVELERSAGSVEDFYRSLDMRLKIEPLSRSNAERIAQLTQKTNQFNLTTRRYTEQQLHEMANRPGVEIYCASVGDRLGENGVVAAMITRARDDAWAIDCFLLSCRVIGRTVETALLAYLAEQARHGGARKLIAEFIRTKKNEPARGLLPGHGFRLVEKSANGAETWELDLETQTVAMPDYFTLTAAPAEKSASRAMDSTNVVQIEGGLS